MKSLAEFAKEHAGNWQKFESFYWGGQPDQRAENWCIVYTSNRDSGLCDTSNAKQIAEIFEEDLESEDHIKAESHSHWACGYVDGYSICVYDEEGDITPTFKKWYAIQKKLADYPLLNEDHYSELEYETACTWIREEGKNFVKEKTPEGWESEVFSWLWENNQCAVENTDDQGASPSDEAIKEALSELEMLDEDI